MKAFYRFHSKQACRLALKFLRWLKWHLAQFDGEGAGERPGSTLHYVPQPARLQHQRRPGSTELSHPSPSSKHAEDTGGTPIDTSMRHMHEIGHPATRITELADATTGWLPGGIFPTGDAPAADNVDGASHVDVHKVHTHVIVHQLAASRHRVWKAACHLDHCSKTTCIETSWHDPETTISNKIRDCTTHSFTRYCCTSAAPVPGQHCILDQHGDPDLGRHLKSAS